MKECDEQNSHLSSKLHMIYISSNNDRHSVTKTFTPLHYSCRHFTSLPCPFIGLIPFKFPTAPFHLTSLHFTSLHFTALLEDRCHISISFTSPRL